MRNVFLILALLFYGHNSSANNYRVQISVFEQSVASDYFYDVDQVKLSIDINDLYRYYIGDFEDKERAEAAKNDLINKGYKYAKVIDLEAERIACASSCKVSLYVQHIFFDFDRSNLRTKSRQDLDDLVYLMQDNPEYKVELSAHTDAHGSLAYNTALSQRRAITAKDYLMAKGIDSDRIMTSEFGESAPIAKNDVNGKDSPKGRQYNRRVVITVMKSNGLIVPNVVLPIDVPEGLKVD